VEVLARVATAAATRPGCVASGRAPRIGEGESERVSESLSIALRWRRSNSVSKSTMSWTGFAMRPRGFIAALDNLRQIVQPQGAPQQTVRQETRRWAHGLATVADLELGARPKFGRLDVDLAKPGATGEMTSADRFAVGLVASHTDGRDGAQTSHLRRIPVRDVARSLGCSLLRCSA